MRPHKHQIEAAKIAGSLDRCGIQIVTGGGKSLTMALLVNALQMRTLIVVPNLSLRSQLRATFVDLFGSLDNILIENIDSPALKTATDYDVLILDECHHSAATTYRKLNRTAWKNIYHRYFFSGTFFRSQESEQLAFEGIAGRCVYNFSYLEAVAAKVVTPVEAYFFDLPIQEMKGTESDWHSVHNELIVNNEKRNALICSLLITLKANGISTLCLTKEVAHGRALAAATDIPFACGEEDTTTTLLANFNSKAPSCLIATSGVAGEGVDTRPTEYVILAGGGKSQVQFQQQVGRALRLYPGKISGKLVLFRDASSKYLLDHFNQCVKYLKQEYGVKIVKLEDI